MNNSLFVYSWFLYQPDGTKFVILRKTKLSDMPSGRNKGKRKLDRYCLNFICQVAQENGLPQIDQAMQVLQQLNWIIRWKLKG